MLLKIVEGIFIISAVLFGFSLIINKVYVVKLKDNLKKSDYVAGIAILLAMYVILSLVLGILIPSVYKKSVMLLFALSPFIIGKLATYEKEKIYTAIQILSVFISVLFVILFG